MFRYENRALELPFLEAKVLQKAVAVFKEYIRCVRLICFVSDIIVFVSEADVLSPRGAHHEHPACLLSIVPPRLLPKAMLELGV